MEGKAFFFIALCFVRGNLLLRTLPFHFGHVTFNGVPQVPGIIMHFLDNTLVPFVAPLLFSPCNRHHHTNCRLSFCIVRLVSPLAILHRSSRLRSPSCPLPGSLVLIPFRSCAIFPATCLAALQSKSNITSHAKGVAPPLLHALISLSLSVSSFPPPSASCLSYDQAELPYASRPGEGLRQTV